MHQEESFLQVLLEHSGAEASLEIEIPTILVHGGVFLVRTSNGSAWRTGKMQYHPSVYQGLRAPEGAR